MNKVILMGRLTRDPELRYSKSADPVAVCKYTLAVNRRFKRDEADFINVTSFGKTAEFADKYFQKGQKVSVVGRLQVSSWENDEGKRQWRTEVIVDEQYFAESKKSFENNKSSNKKTEDDGFHPINETVQDDDLPF